MTRKFAIHTVLFFIPVLIGCITVEILTRKLPMRYTYLSTNLQKEKDSIEILVLGSSQTKTAVNPEWLSQPTLNLASTSQHHDTDFKLYTGLKDRLPKLNTVIIEVSYSHFELPHNGPDFWKNNIFLEYFDANCFERRAWLKDRIIFLSNPPFYSDALYDEYIGKKSETEFNEFGFDRNNFEGIFSLNKYNESLITKLDFKIITRENHELFKKNSNYLFEMLNTFSEDNLDVIIVTTPLYKDYLIDRNSNIVNRRDSILNIISKRFSNVTILQHEQDSIQFKVTDFLNHNHLNPDGARKFSKLVDDIINE